MALINCPQCGAEVSEHAEKCVQCGYQLKETVATPAQTDGSGVTMTSEGAHFNPDYGAGYSLFRGFIDGWKNILRLRGRARRKEFWGWTLFTTIFELTLGTVVGSAFMKFGVTGLLLVFVCVYCVIKIIASFTITVRRLHDSNLSGWNILWPLVPIIGAVLYIYFLIRSGNSCDNSYGEDPRGDPLAD